MARLEELLKADTEEELESLAIAWSHRMTNGQWTIHQGYSPKRVKQTKNGYEIFLSVERKDLPITS
jgi:hypothetical protein